MWTNFSSNFLTRFVLSLSFLCFSMASFAQQDATVRGNNVNIRDCAGLDCNVLFQLSTGDKCQVLFNMKDEDIIGYGINSWYKIEAGGKEGFIYGAFLDFISNDLKTAVMNANPSYNLITADEVNVRACGGLACNKVFQLNQGDKIKIIGKTSDYFVPGIGKQPWYEIEHNGQKGFVFAHFVDCQNCDFSSPTTTPVTTTITNSNQGTITGDQVNIRSCEKVSCGVVFQMNLGDQCLIQKKIPNQSDPNDYPWYQIEVGGKSGFVYGKYLSEPSAINNSVKIWALIAGVSDYSDFSNTLGVSDLNFCDSDAKRIYQFLKSPEGGNVPNQQITLLRNEEATKNNILTNAERLFSQAKADDLVIIYFSGHGAPNYFLAHDQPLKYSDIKQVIENSKAKKRICIADACFSGSWSDNATAQVVNKNLTNDQLERLYYEALSNSGNGIALFMSSGRNQTSIELPQLKQGLFTYFFIEGLKGYADADQNKIITIQELYEFVKYGVTSIASEQFNHPQTPTISGFFDNTMPIGVVRK